MRYHFNYLGEVTALRIIAYIILQDQDQA